LKGKRVERVKGKGCKVQDLRFFELLSVLSGKMIEMKDIKILVSIHVLHRLKLRGRTFILILALIESRSGLLKKSELCT
jgi:hypothetical protein